MARRDPHAASGVLGRDGLYLHQAGPRGGGLLLALNLAWIQRPDLFGLPSGEGLTPEQSTLPSRLALVSVAFRMLLAYDAADPHGGLPFWMQLRLTPAVAAYTVLLAVGGLGAGAIVRRDPLLSGTILNAGKRAPARPL